MRPLLFVVHNLFINFISIYIGAFEKWMAVLRVQDVSLTSIVLLMLICNKSIKIGFYENKGSVKG